MLFALLALAASKARSPSLGDSTQKCIMCKFYCSMIDDWLEEGKTVEEIVEKAEQLCQHIAEEYRGICKTLVDEFIPIIIKYLEQELEANEICKLIKFCKD